VAFFPAPKSYTGEDVAEIHLHGNPLVLERAAAAACSLGAVPGAPGEFSKRAFLNGKMDLTQAEGLSDLIAARTEAAAGAALRQLKGGIGRTVAPLRERMLELLVRIEASIDFSDEEDITPVSTEQLSERVSELRLSLERMLRSFSVGHRFRDGATVAIAGVTNVGKSSLLNRLLGEERAIVTEVPGTTRDYLCGEMALSGIPVRFVDTAGLRTAKDPVEAEGVRRSLEILSAADLALFLLDAGRPARAADRRAYALVEGRPHLLVLNKIDLPRRETGGAFRGEGRKGLRAVSARTGEGMEDLLSEIAREIAPEGDAIMTEAPMTRLRHAVAVEKAIKALARAERGIPEGLPLEFLAADIREASAALSELLGEIAPEEVLDAVFGSFCIGK
jgi:tRNA modification GTPase